MSKHFLLLFLTFLGWQVGLAQNIRITSTPQAEVSIGTENGAYQVKVENLSGSVMNNVTFQVSLPTGMNYVSGSLSESSTFQIQEKDISNLNSPVFQANSLSNGSYYQFTLQYKGSCQAVNYQLGGNIFRNVVTLSSSLGSVTHTSVAYNILYPSLSITTINPKNQTITNKGSYTRQITVVNGGNGGITDFYISDSHPAGLQITATDKGSLTGGNLIYLSANDFKSIGDKDGIFDSNESIVVTQTVYGETCVDVTYTSTINAYWQLNGSQCQSSSTFGNVFVDFITPTLKQTATASFNTCYSVNPSPQQLQVQNTTAINAGNVQVDIFNSSGADYDPNIFTKIDVSSITYKIGATGTLTPITPTTTYPTTSGGVYSCLGTDAVGKVTLSLPNIPANQSVYIYWNTQHCCINSCIGAKVGGWKSTVRFTDECNVAYTNTITGQNPVQANMTFFTETPAYISSGQKKTFSFLVSSHTNTYPVATGAYYEVVFQLPKGLVYEGATDDLVWLSTPNKWTPTSVSYDAAASTLTARYPLPAAFSLPKTEINLKLKADCNVAGATAGSNSIAMSVYFVPNPACTTICKIPLACSKTVTTTLLCPGLNCAEGLSFENFTLQRTSFGLPDNNTDGLADASGSLDMTKIKTNRIMTNDTLKAVFYGKVITSGGRPTWQYGYAKSTVPLGAYLTPLSGYVKIFDASANTYLNASGVTIQKTTSAETGTFNMDFSLPTLVSKGNTQLNGFQWENNDLIELTVYYTLSTNIGGKIQEVTFNNEFYVSDIANPTSAANKFQCGFYNENITLMGYYFYTDKGISSSITTCSSYIDQLYYLSIGDCCSNYEGGNLFPYEYRNWGRIKEGKVTIPNGYKVLNIKLEQWITKATNSSTYEVKTGLQPDSQNGNELYFNLEKYYKAYGGTFNLSDDGFKGKLSVEIAPTCAVPTGVYQDMPWNYTFTRAARLENGTTTAWMTEQPDKIRYNPTTLQISALNPKEDGLNKTVTWTVYIKNTTANSDARNAWLHIKSLTGNVKVQKVIDAATNLPVALIGDIYQLGQVNLSSTKTYYITATYSACTLESINVFSGYECSGYPNNFASFTCPYTQTTLSVEPKPAQFQVRIKNTYVGNPCSGNMQVEVEVRSVQLASVDSLKVDFTTPANGSMVYISGTGALQYNTSTAYRSIANPTTSGNVNSYYIPQFDSFIAQNGLPGVLNLSNNTLKLKFNVQLNANFKPGDYLSVSVNGNSPCGLILPQINLAVDPSVKFEQDVNSGLSTGTTNSWSASWGDYDNDGDEDLFVPEYDKTKPSHLYRNNGNGTFTETSTVIANDRTSATAASWGDYDNDGDLDLYVATNIGGSGLLYNNLGNGTFRKITSGEIATDDGYDHSASWVDYDNDGYLDLFVLDIMQTEFNKLYHNNGNGTFTKVKDAAIVTAVSSSIGATWSDYDNDGDMDVFIPNRDQENFLYRNDGNGKFTRILDGQIVTEVLGSVGSSWGDYDNDGDMDLFVANAGTKLNALYKNNGNGTFTKVTSGVVVNDKGNTHGSTWADFDNDGDLDLYVTNDAGEGNFLYMNNGDGTFQKLENDLTELKQNSFGTAVADYDNDGDLDIFVANHSGQPNQLYINSRGKCNQSICFKLIGTKSNRSAIGSKVRIKATINGKVVWQMREITAQTGGGVGSQNTLKAYFGLGDAVQADEVIIEWASGLVQKLGVQSAGICHEVTEQQGSTVCGAIYHDANGNCVKDAGEKGIPNQKIRIVSADKTYNLQTDSLGNYQLYLAAGSYQITQETSTGWATCNNAGYSVQVSAGGQANCGYNFGNTPTCTQPDLVISAGSTVLHRGFENTFVISYANTGVTTAQNVSIQMTFPSQIAVQRSDVSWSSVSGNTYTWNVGDLAAFAKGNIQIVTKTLLTATVGQPLTTAFSIAGSNGECSAGNNSLLDVSPVMGAVDPNDLLVSHTEINRADETLTYTIRFQNVGNYPATYVRVSDNLPEKLDLSTFELVGVSHNITNFYIEGRNLRWEFDHINLIDSLTDEAASHGFIKFKIKPVKTLVHGDTLSNQAQIIFDFDGVIATNVVNTIYHNPSERHIDAFPNPMAASDGILKFKGDMTYPFDFSLYNSLGVKLYQQRGIETNEVNLKPIGLKPGIYLYHLHDRDGVVMTKGRLVVL
jgi:uncharacterized repeat protein (TIGR01451 family)